MTCCICEVEHAGDHPWCPSCHPESVTAPDDAAEIVDRIVVVLSGGPRHGQVEWINKADPRLYVDWFPHAEASGECLSGYYEAGPVPNIWDWHLTADTRKR